MTDSRVWAGGDEIKGLLGIEQKYGRVFKTPNSVLNYFPVEMDRSEIGFPTGM